MSLSDQDANVRPFENLPVKVCHVCCTCKEELVVANSKMASQFEQILFEKDSRDRENYQQLQQKYQQLALFKDEIA